MINSIYSGNFELKDFSCKKRINGSTSVPVYSLQNSVESKNYSLNNLKANYMPVANQNVISFGNQKNQQAYSLNELRNQARASLPVDDTHDIINGIPREQLVKGTFYKQFSDDLAIWLDTEKDLIFPHEKDVSPEIFVHKFTENILNNQYKGMGLSADNTDVILIHDPEKFALRYWTENQISASSDIKLLESRNDKGVFEVDINKEKTDMSKLFFNCLDNLKEKDEKRKIIFMKDFDKIVGGINGLNNYNHKGTTFKSFKTFLEETYPNISIIGLIDKESLTLPKEEEGKLVTDEDIVELKIILNNLKDFQKPELEDLGTTESKEFLKKNPQFLNPIFEKYPNFKFTPVSEEAISEAVDIAATSIKGSLLSSTIKFLKLITTAKVNEQAANVKSKIEITPDYVKKFPSSHKKIFDTLKPENQGIEIVENVKTRFSDVGGQKEAKKKFDKVMQFIKDPEGWIASGKKVPNMLMEGPPGTGKTLLARAAAGELGIPFFYKNGSNFGNNLINSGTMEVNQVYDEVEKHLRKTGKKVAILFIDEADTLGKKRSSSEHNQEDNKTVNAWITRMDGFNTKESDIHIITIAATNRAEIMDPALLDRDERLGNRVKVGVAELKEDRLEVLNIHAKKKKFESEAEKARLLDKIADIASGLNNDKLSSILDVAADYAQETTGKEVITENAIMEGFLSKVFGQKRPTDIAVEMQEKSSFHEAGHALMALVTDFSELLFISNEPRGNSLAAIYSKIKNNLSHSFETAMQEIICCYGGAEAEKLLQNGHGSGVSGDYGNITEVMESMTKKWGLGVFTPQFSLVDKEGKDIEWLVKENSALINKDYELFSQTGQKIAKTNVEFYKDFLLNTYMDTYREKIASNGNGNFLGSEFADLLKKWVKDNKKEKEAKALDLWVKETIELTKKAKEGDNLTKLAERTFKYVAKKA